MVAMIRPVLRLAPVAAALLVGSPAMAEITTVIDSYKPVSGMDKAKSFSIKCHNCWAADDRLTERVKAAGFRVVGIDDSPDVKLILEAEVSLPIDGRVPNIDGEDVLVGRFMPVPPAIKSPAGVVATGSLQARNHSALDADGGHIAAGAAITGSAAGGVLIGSAISLVRGLINDRDASATRVPGVARVTMRIWPKEGTREFLWAVAAADTTEDPKDLLNAAIEAAIMAAVDGCTPLSTRVLPDKAGLGTQ